MMLQQQVGLIFFYLIYMTLLGVYMFKVRFKAVKEKRIRGRYFKDYQGEIPEDIKVLGNHFNNQFQVPLIFMITSLFAIVTKTLSPLFFYLSCVFVLTRIMHTYFHVFNHVVLIRAGVFFSGFFILLVMWALILFNL